MIIKGALMPKRINIAIELLEEDQPIYYTGPHSGHILTYEEGLKDSQTWADYINVGMEHGCFDMTALDNYIRGLIDGWPTKSGHRTPPIIVELPVEGTEENISILVEWAHHGPANAIVENVEIHNEKFNNEFVKFDVLY